MFGRENEFVRDGRIVSQRNRTIGEMVVDVLSKGGSIQFECQEPEKRVRVMVTGAHTRKAMVVSEITLDTCTGGPETALGWALNECERAVYG